jgi:predicted amidohydrolase YtcJ
LIGAVVLAGCASDVEPADLVLRNGKVVTVDDAQPEAEALAVVGDRIVAVGSNQAIASYIGASTEVIDLDGQLAVPGFIEGHGHFMRVGEAQLNLDLTQVRSWEEIVSMVDHVVGDQAAGTWILGRGWHQEKWDSVPDGSVDGVPTHASLSAVSPDNPVLLTHASGHAAYANAKALEISGITRATPDPAGGEIVHDASGNPTGLLRETAQRIVSGTFDAANATRSAEELEAEAVRVVELAGEELLRKGVTGFHDAGSNFATIDFLKELAEQGRLPVRLYVMVRRESNEVMAERLPEYRMIGVGNNHLTVRSIKRQIDGALGSHGAWLLEPYVDMTESVGLVLEPVEDIVRTAEIAIEHGFQVNTHAIGDRGNREVLDIYQRAFEAAGQDGKELRWRIEHAQHIHPDDVPRFAELGVIAAMQGVHATSDAPWVFRRLGPERAESGAYLWQQLMRSGAIVTNGTDAPVEDVSPIASFYSSVARRALDGTPFFPDERMSREEALRTYTLNVAYSAFEEDIKGSLTPGKLADITVLSRDIMTIPEEDIPEAQVVYTIVGGKVLYTAEDGN